MALALTCVWLWHFSSSSIRLLLLFGLSGLEDVLTPGTHGSVDLLALAQSTLLPLAHWLWL